MAIDAATNCWTGAEVKLRTALSESAAFQSFVGATNANEAVLKVLNDRLDKPNDTDAFTWEERAELKAYALVASSGNQPFTLTWEGVPGDEPLPSGRLVMVLERMVTPPDEHTQDTETDSYAQVERWFKNRVGTILREIGIYWKQNGGPVPRTATVTDGPGHNDEKKRRTDGHWQGCEVEFVWGQTQ